MRCQVCGQLGPGPSVRCGVCGANLIADSHTQLAAIKYLMREVLKWKADGRCDAAFAERTLAPYLTFHDELVQGLLSGLGAGTYPLRDATGLTARAYLAREEEATRPAPGAATAAPPPATAVYEPDPLRALAEARRRREAAAEAAAVPAVPPAAGPAAPAPAPAPAPAALPIAAPAAATPEEEIPLAVIVPDAPASAPAAPPPPRPRPKPVPPPVPLQPLAPPKPVEPPVPPEKLKELAAERTLRWLLNLGIFIFSVASTVFVWNQWEEWAPVAKIGVLALVTAILCGGGAWLKRGYLLRTTGLAVFILGTLFFPIDFFAVAHFKLVPEVPIMGVVGGLACAVAYGLLARAGGELLYAYLAGLSGIAAYLFGLRAAEVPPGHFPAHVPLLALAYYAAAIALKRRPGVTEDLLRLASQPLYLLSMAGWVLTLPALGLALAGEWLTLRDHFGVIAYGFLGCAAYGMAVARLESVAWALWPAAVLKAVLAALALVHYDVPLAEAGAWLMPLGTLFWGAAALLARRVEAEYLQPYLAVGVLLSVAAVVCAAAGLFEPTTNVLPLMGALAWPLAAFAVLTASERAETPAYPVLIGLAVEYTLWLVHLRQPLERFPVWLAVGQLALTCGYLATRAGGWEFLQRPALVTVHVLGIGAGVTLLADIGSVYETHAELGLAAAALLAGSYWLWAWLVRSEDVAWLASLLSAGAYVFVLRWLGVDWKNYMLWLDVAALALVGAAARGPALAAGAWRGTANLLVGVGLGLAVAVWAGAGAGLRAAAAAESGRCALSGLLATAFYVAQSLRVPRRWAELAALAVLTPTVALALDAAGADGLTIRPVLALLAAAYVGLAFGTQRLAERPYVDTALGAGLVLAALAVASSLLDPRCYTPVANMYCPILTCLLVAALATALCFVTRPVTWVPGAVVATGAALLINVTYLLALHRYSTGSIYGGIAVFGMCPFLAGAAWAMRRRGMAAEWGPFAVVSVLNSALAIALSLPYPEVRMVVFFACSALYGALVLLFDWKPFSFLASLAVVGGYYSILEMLHVPDHTYIVWFITLGLGKVVVGSVVEGRKEEPRQHPLVVVGLGITFLALGALVVNAREYVGTHVDVGMGAAFLCAVVYVAAWLFQKKPMFLYLSAMSLVGAYYIYAFHQQWEAAEAYTAPMAVLVLVWAHLVGRRKWGVESGRSLDALGMSLLLGPSILLALDMSQGKHALAAVLIGLLAVVAGTPLKKRVYVYGGTIGFVLTVLIKAVQILIEARLSGTAWGMIIGGGIFALAALLEYARRKRQQAIERGEGGVRAMMDRWFEGWE